MLKIMKKLNWILTIFSFYGHYFGVAVHFSSNFLLQIYSNSNFKIKNKFLTNWAALCWSCSNSAAESSSPTPAELLGPKCTAAGSDCGGCVAAAATCRCWVNTARTSSANSGGGACKFFEIFSVPIRSIKNWAVNFLEEIRALEITPADQIKNL